MTAPPAHDPALALFHPVVRDWFGSRFAGPTPPQAAGWPAIGSGRDVLIAAPTGSGKTLTAFLAGIDRLVVEALEHGLAEETRIVYVSPLRALSNDIRRNLTEPLSEIVAACRRTRPDLPEIRAEVRTGDTPAAERQRMVRRPPHILVTTPESLYLYLTAARARETLRTVETVIVDEIHALVGDKRGSHLALSLERLEALVAKRPQRIGLSATQARVDVTSDFLVGARAPRAPEIVDAGHVREIDVAVEAPDHAPLEAVCTNEQWESVYDRIVSLVEAHRSTIIFVNTRRLAERITHRLALRLGEDAVSSHHGSLSMRIRHDTEQRLKAGALRAVVATASLELGIDVGHVDLVIQIGTPRRIAAMLQRIGRAGHSLGATPKGRIFALTRDELVECAALVRAILEERLDQPSPPVAPLDVLAQQIVAACVVDDWDEDALFETVRGAAPYRALAREDFDRVLEMLAEGIAGRRGRQGALLHRDRINGQVRARRRARLTAITSGGAIPEIASFRVVTDEETPTVVGSLDEDFAIESSSGDIFLLGNTSWEIRHIRGGDVVVRDARGAPPTIPFWRGEAPGRSDELSLAVSELRGELSRRIGEIPEASETGDEPVPPPDAVAWAAETCHLAPEAAVQLVRYLMAEKAAVGFVPTQRRVLFERFFDESGGMQIVIHAPFGIRINRAWGLALRKRFCRSFDFELQAAADDDGIVLSLGEQHSFPLDQLFTMLNPTNGRPLLEQATLAVPFFGTRWRWNAIRALAVRRWEKGRKVPPALLRMRAEDLLTSVFPMQTACLENVVGEIEIPDHVLIGQTMHDCLTEAMDVDRWLDVLAEIDAGKITLEALDTREPSPFSHALLNANPYAFLDDAPLEERRARAVSARRTLSIESVRDLGALDPEAIETVRAEAWPLVREPDELHDTLLSATILPAADAGPWAEHLEPLVASGRAARVQLARDGRDAVEAWIATERWPEVGALRPDAVATPPIALPPSLERAVTREDAALAVVRGRLEMSGPETAASLAERLALSEAEVAVALATLESDGVVLRGRFTEAANASDDDATIEWCNRRLLARIHRLTLDGLRKRIRPVPIEAYVRFLCRHQHLHPKARLSGSRAISALVELLAGFEAPAAAWEPELLARRMDRYEPTWLDLATTSGEVIWGRVRAPAPRAEGSGRPMKPFTRVAPITLLPRADAVLLGDGGAAGPFERLSSRARDVFDLLSRDGALFASQIAKRAGLLPSELDEVLGELAAMGLVTSDGFAALRALIGTSASAIAAPRHPRAAAGGRLRGRSLGSRRALSDRRLDAGRWSLLARELETGGEDTGDARIRLWCETLLRRWGVLFRDLLARESGAPPWYLLVRKLRRMEARGEIRGGRFVAGVGGEQYALGDVIQPLRDAVDADDETIVVAAATDPINLFGRVTEDDTVPAISGHVVVIRNGRLAGAGRPGEVALEVPIS